MHSPRAATTTSLYAQVCLVNALVLGVAVLALLVSPAQVSSRTLAAEGLLVLAGLAAVLLAEVLLLRSTLAPVDRVVRQLADVEHGRPGDRLPEHGTGAASHLVRGVNTMLDRLETEQRSSSARALAAQEAERQRVAQELHDQVGQSLTVVLLGLKQVEQHAPAELRAELRLVRDSARAALDDVRRVARELRPGVLADLGLLSALAALCSEFEAHGGAPVRRVVSPGLPALGPDAELVVYRVAQEALTNVARHAEAREVTVSLTRLGDAVVLEVCDDGRGGPGAVVPGAGVTGMHERALLVGGTLLVEGGAVAGTRVRLCVPLDAAPSLAAGRP